MDNVLVATLKLRQIFLKPRRFNTVQLTTLTNTIQKKLLQGKHQSNTFYNDNICKEQKKGKRKNKNLESHVLHLHAITK